MPIVCLYNSPFYKLVRCNIQKEQYFISETSGDHLLYIGIEGLDKMWVVELSLFTTSVMTDDSFSLNLSINYNIMLLRLLNLQVDTCLKDRQNETSAMAEKALHQMVVCGYALIGHDPGRAVARVVDLKSMIKQGVQPVS